MPHPARPRLRAQPIMATAHYACRTSGLCKNARKIGADRRQKSRSRPVKGQIPRPCFSYKKGPKSQGLWPPDSVGDTMPLYPIAERFHTDPSWGCPGRIVFVVLCVDKAAVRLTQTVIAAQPAAQIAAAQRERNPIVFAAPIKHGTFRRPQTSHSRAIALVLSKKGHTKNYRAIAMATTAASWPTKRLGAMKKHARRRTEEPFRPPRPLFPAKHPMKRRRTHDLAPRRSIPLLQTADLSTAPFGSGADAPKQSHEIQPDSRSHERGGRGASRSIAPVRHRTADDWTTRLLPRLCLRLQRDEYDWRILPQSPAGPGRHRIAGQS